MTPVLEVVDASVRFDAFQALAGVSLSVEPGTVVGLVGPNGAGKTTLLDAVSGFVPLAGGRVSVDGVDVSSLPPHRRARLGLARTFQALDLFDDLTVEENLLVAGGAGGGDRRMPATLPSDDRKDVALDRALAAGPKVVLLDEPAAGLDAGGRAALVERLRLLRASGMAVVLADHDLDLVLGLCDSVCVLDFGKVIALGPPSAVRADPAVVAAYLGGPAHGVCKKAGISGTSAQSLLAGHGLVAGYGSGPVLHGVDIEVRGGEVVALLGANGAGKTTTLRALSGVLPLAAGRVEVLGATVKGRPHRLARRGLASVPQDRAVLPSLTVSENLRLAAARGAAAAVLQRFPVLEPLRDRRAGQLSGGEQQILALARALAREPRVLLVDELSMGLAPRAARHALDAVRDLATRGAAVLVAEQHPNLALEVADRAVILARGRVVHEGPAEDLAANPEILRAAYLG